MSTPNNTTSQTPQVIETENIFRGRVIEVTVDTVKEGEVTYKREVVHHAGSAVIIPVFDDGTIALVRQYRHPTGRYLLEAPAGTLRRGEEPAKGAARELEEELGVLSGRLEKLSEFFVSPGFCEEKMWLYLARELTETKQQLEDDEILEVVRIPFSHALSMITNGEIEDAKTIIGVMLAAPRVGPAMLEASYPAV
jgi:ADP-ribose pyrophosphatase